MRLLWLPEVLRGAGLQVVEVDGWRTRGGDSFDPSGLVCHATAGSRSATDQGEISVLLHGSSTAPPPIAQLYLSRSGTWHVVASGRCNHALTGWAGPLQGLGNSQLIGIEAANDNAGEPWPAAQYEAYVRGVAAICRRMGWPVGRVVGHKEHQPAGYGRSSTKTDPTFDMGAFRVRVAGLIEGTQTVSVWSEISPSRQGPTSTGNALVATYDSVQLDIRPALTRLEAAAAAEEARDRAVLAAVEALATAGGVDAAPIVAAIQAARAETVRAVQLLLDENRELRERLAAALAPPPAP